MTLQSTLVENTLVRDRALALLSAFFSVVAIVLVVVGLYGVLSYSVVQRTREIGIRLALGARPLRVMGLVLSEVGAMTVIGLALGSRRRNFRRAVHHSAVVRSEAIGHVEHRRAADLPTVRVRFGRTRSGLACDTYRSHDRAAS